MAAKPATSNALTVAVSNDDITAKLRALGALEEGGQTYNRVEWKDQIFTLGDEQYISNPKTGTPAMRIRILSAPAEYQAFFFAKDGVDAQVAGRDGSIVGKFCRSYYDEPSQKREYAEDGTSCRTCPINPFVKNSPLASGRKCSWRGDLQFQVLDADGAISDETVWTLTLPTTAMIEFKGTKKDPIGGSVSELNFQQRLARLALEGVADKDVDAALYKAWTGLSIGNVIADVHAIPTSSQDGGQRYSVISLRPVQILDDVPAPAAVAAGGSASGDVDDLPF